ncbi:MAG: hypothetical protein GY765_10880, partial [bacterium]|nr:hypothetical protein [bacterium]
MYRYHRPFRGRQDAFFDNDSILLNKGAFVKNLAMRGIHNARHTRTSIKSLFNAYRDRYSNPPLTLSLSLLPTVHFLQVGDIVRVNLAQIEDLNTGAALDRSFEVQQISTNLIDGSVKVTLFGSSGDASILADEDAADAAELPDGWYSTNGTDLGASLSIDGSGFLTANGTLNGGTSSRTWFYYLGDFTIPSGRTLTLDENVGLAIMGYFQNDGTIVSNSSSNVASFIGTTVSGRGLLLGGNGAPSYQANSINAKTNEGLNPTLPALLLTNDAGVLNGIPEDMRGSGGPQGGAVLEWNANDD